MYIFIDLKSLNQSNLIKVLLLLPLLLHFSQKFVMAFADALSRIGLRSKEYFLSGALTVCIYCIESPAIETFF